MNSNVAHSVAKKVTVTVETADGMTYIYNFGDGDHTRLQVNAAVNQEYDRVYRDGFLPVAQYVTRREFNLKINY